MLWDISTLFPSSTQPHLGLFVQRRLEALAELRQLRAMVGIGRFPIIEFHPRYRARRLTESSRMFGSTHVEYLRYLSVPRYLKRADGASFGRALVTAARSAEFAPTVLLAELAYPDGMAALHLSNRLKLPFVVTVRGHDVNDLPSDPIHRALISRVLSSANAVACVADALGDAVVALGAERSRVHTVPNGVDASVFSVDRQASRKALGIQEEDKLLVSVGHLVERKGHHLIVEALSKLPSLLRERTRLIIVGGPSEEGDASKLVSGAIASAGLQERVELKGAMGPADVARHIAAADGLVLASSKEGRPNVLLESFCSGTPVVATRVWGTPELLPNASFGVLVERSVAGLADGIGRLLTTQYDVTRIQEWGRSFSWERSARALDDLLTAATREGWRGES